LFGGFVAGVAMRVVTAGSSGANIGGALALYVLPFPLLAILAWAAAQCVRVLRSERTAAPDARAASIADVE
jgi:hypothetical protein